MGFGKMGHGIGAAHLDGQSTGFTLPFDSYALWYFFGIYMRFAMISPLIPNLIVVCLAQTVCSNIRGPDHRIIAFPGL